MMTAAEKNQAYDMLYTISSWLKGYPDEDFKRCKPNFTDDTLVPHADKINNTEEQNSSIPSTSPESISTETIAAKIRNCTRCGLCKTRTNTVPGMGVKNPLVMVIGEGPGADEDASGLPFVGKAGQLLDKMLAAISLSRNSNCFIANIVKCRPPGNRDPLPEERDACSAFLEAQISVLKPKMILIMGRVALQSLLNTAEGIGRLRGQLKEYRGIPVMATYHPSALLRNEEMKRPAWDDLKKFRERLQQICPGYEQTFNTDQQK